MYCCANCFSDPEIKAIINGYRHSGDCDFCGSKDVNVYDMERDSTIAEMFDGILDVYTPITDLPDGFPTDQTGYLKDILHDTWNMFNLDSDKIYTLIRSLCSNRYSDQPELFDKPVGILQSCDPTYLEENSILKNYCWNDFVNGIKRENRFHSNYINTEMLYMFLRCIVKAHHKDEELFRARMCPDTNGYECCDMGAPPPDRARGGRVNPVGISILYLSNDEETTFHEIRAGVYDYVSVGKFRLLRDINVINLMSINHISPFIGMSSGFDFTQYAINIEHLRMISQEIEKPLRNDNMLDYIPTQYVSDFIRSKGYSGIEYASTMHKDGVNLAVFDPNLFECISREVYDVKSILYEYKTV